MMADVCQVPGRSIGGMVGGMDAHAKQPRRDRTSDQIHELLPTGILKRDPIKLCRKQSQVDAPLDRKLAQATRNDIHRPVLLAYLGLHGNHPRAHAGPERSRSIRQSPVSWYLRYAILGRGQSEPICPRSRSATILGVSRTVECGSQRLGMRDHSHGSS